MVIRFAFLGPAYDLQLRAVYTGIGPQDVYEERGLLKAVFSESIVDTAPLFQLISRYANGAMLTAIAEQYKRPFTADRDNRSRCTTPGNLEHRGDRSERPA